MSFYTARVNNRHMQRSKPRPYSLPLLGRREANPSGLPGLTHRPCELAKVIDEAFGHRTQHPAFQCNNDDD